MNVATESTLREQDIRPEHLKQRENELYEADLARLLKNKSSFVEVACPACASIERCEEFTKYDMKFQRCDKCDMLYVSPRPTNELLDDYYRNAEYYTFWNDYIFPASEDARRAKIFRPRAERTAEICKRLGVATDSFLDVGAGFGTFCEELIDQGLFNRVLAVEPTPSLAETCRKRGIETIEEPIETATVPGGPVNVLASFEVIEHLFSPEQFLARCRELLAPGGLLILTCPNVKGFDIETLGQASDSVEPEHLNYFHPDSLAQLVTRCGFTVEEVTTPGKLDAELVRNKHLAGEIDLNSNPFLKHILIDQWETQGESFQQYLADNCLSSHLWLVARNGTDETGTDDTSADAASTRLESTVKEVADCLKQLEGVPAPPVNVTATESSEGTDAICGTPKCPSETYEAAWMTWRQFRQTIRNKKVYLFGAADDWIDKTFRQSDPNVQCIVDNSEIMKGTKLRDFDVRDPELLKQRSSDSYVVITAGAYDSIIPQLLEYGLQPGTDFCMTPALNNVRVITDMHTHDVNLLICSPDHTIYSQLDQGKKVGGGLYVMRTGTEQLVKVLDGTFHQLVDAGDEYLVADEQRGICRVSKDFELIETFGAEKGDYAHGVAYCAKRNLIFIGRSGLDRVSAFDATTHELAYEIQLSNKHEKLGRSQHWLNDLCIHGDYLYVSMFSHSGAYLHGVYDGGLLQIDLDDVESRNVLCRDAWMPHTVRFFDSQICYLDSMNGRLFRSLKTVVGEFPGFVRGLAFDGAYYYVGQSECRLFEPLKDKRKHIAMTAGVYMFDEDSKAAKFLVLPGVRQIHDVHVIEHLPSSLR